MSLLQIAALTGAMLISTPFVSRAWCADTEAACVYALFDQLMDEGTIAGAQVVLGESDLPVVAKSFGVLDIKTRKPVTDDTRFCIGSCSKMFAAAVIVSLASDGTVDLDAPISKWMEDFSAPALKDGGQAMRAPTLRELLCHRAGVYSQRHRMTRKQTRWIRDFRISLAESVAGIAAEPLTTEPSKEFAYSGAGYCVLGRVAEVAAKTPFDELLSLHVGKPLGLSRTTFFPPTTDKNIASGHTIEDGQLSVVGQTPHLLGNRHKLALIGGSLHAPAREAAEFARMILNKGKSPNGTVLTTEEWEEMTKPHARRPNGDYGFGLTVARDAETGKLRSVSHGGALFGSFSFIVVDYQTKRFGVVTFTGSRKPEINVALQKWVSSSAQ